MAKNQIISINFQGIEIGKIGYDENQRKSSFQYNPDFLENNIYKKSSTIIYLPAKVVITLKQRFFEIINKKQ